uniref:Chromo domain-containing protein n=1 Tax=Panagrolaimus superbus TaxID=310955 RepID=A0A914Y065_9BILA
MFRARHFVPAIEEDDIEVAKIKLKNVLGLDDIKNDCDETSESDEDKYEADGKEFYVVEKVLAHRVVNEKQEFNVKWLNYEDHTWEPLENFVTKGSKMEIYVYFQKKWEKKVAQNQHETLGVGSSSVAKHNQVGRSFGSSHPVPKKESSKVVQEDATAGPSNVTAKKEKERQAGDSGSSSVSLKKKEQNVSYCNSVAGSSKVIAKKGKHEQKPKNKMLDVSFRPKEPVEKSKQRHVEKRSLPSSSHSMQKIQKFKGTTRPMFSQSLNDLKRKMEVQRQQIKERAEKRKKEMDEQERLAREAAEESARYEKIRQEVLADLGSSSDEDDALVDQD